ncbi:pyrroloquinoline quinone precursor peptide PqqA [Paracoccus sp. (in: a-proteobacteria)]
MTYLSCLDVRSSRFGHRNTTFVGLIHPAPDLHSNPVAFSDWRKWHVGGENMAWTKPTLTEIACGMEINMYAPAEDEPVLF